MRKKILLLFIVLAISVNSFYATSTTQSGGYFMELIHEKQEFVVHLMGWYYAQLYATGTCAREGDPIPYPVCSGLVPTFSGVGLNGSIGLVSYVFNQENNDLYYYALYQGNVWEEIAGYQFNVPISGNFEGYYPINRACH
ncbi:hypothetical protein RBH94_13710 [Aestuariibaculum sp. YM273]|uniref:hypothetical protein n=1 Tax=Aestuariibaculum sp. YM273 TaxID=3070659 RepID=UPI0027DD82E4|nr:hypothetical protein [Aestuariibaculum sp. YM273]WMI65105.1 hypothetical protein RBH94_13710 [Aestuariibaculum sp. YM273]